MKYKKIDNILLINGDCFDVMDQMKKQKKMIDLVLTSPPYNTCRAISGDRAIKNLENRYDSYEDNKSEQEYIDWSISLFNKYDEILENNGVILYNMSYGSENPNIMWKTIAKIIEDTNFMIADSIVWKKNSALPNNVSKNKLTRIIEYVFVFCRKNEYKTFNSNKQVKSISEKTGQKFYENIFNFIEAKNNDGSCNLNKATFSTELVLKLLDIYANKDSVVYDSFMGTGTTAKACKEFGISCIGSELSYSQWEYSVERVSNI